MSLVSSSSLVSRARTQGPRQACFSHVRPRLGQGEAEPAIFGKINMGLNMLQSLLLPFAMLPMLHFTGSVAVMGRFAGSFRVRAVTALCVVLV